MRKWFPLLLLVITILATLPYFPQFQGDSYIHYQYAVNLARGMFMQYNPGEPTGGTTAPLWTGILALVSFLTGKAFLDMAAKLLGALASFGAGLLLLKIFRERLGPTEDDFLIPFLLVLDPYFAFWAGSGMEASAGALALLVGLFFFWKKRPWFTGGVMALALLLRPEMALVLLLFVALRPRAWFQLLFPSVFLGGLYYGAIYASTLTPFPASWETRRIQAVFTEYAMPLGPIAITGLPLYYIFAAHMPLALLAMFSGKRLGRLGWVILLIYMVFYTVVVPTAYGMRYLMPVIPLLVLLAADGARRVGLRLRWLMLVMIPFWALGLARKMRNVRYTAEGRRNYAQAGAWIKKNTPQDALLAAKEVQISWFSDRRVLSVDGVTDGKVNAYIKAGDDLTRFFWDYRPDYMVGLPDVVNNRWNRRSILRRVFEQSIMDLMMDQDPNFVINGIGFRLVAPGIYRLDYPGPKPQAP